ncbi:MAG: hypothetical protein GF364_15065 [Candidatus Lokiarchaeota archaeon]|nr:hypothetical protein [Candidatus Lokiarchaeota archaeon]
MTEFMDKADNLLDWMRYMSRFRSQIFNRTHHSRLKREFYTIFELEEIRSQIDSLAGIYSKKKKELFLALRTTCRSIAISSEDNFISIPLINMLVQDIDRAEIYKVYSQYMKLRIKLKEQVELLSMLDKDVKDRNKYRGILDFCEFCGLEYANLYPDHSYFFEQFAASFAQMKQQVETVERSLSPKINARSKVKEGRVR